MSELCSHGPEWGQWLVKPDGTREWLPLPPTPLVPCQCGKGRRCPVCGKEECGLVEICKEGKESE